jgi:hypothetical protein
MGELGKEDREAEFFRKNKAMKEEKEAKEQARIDSMGEEERERFLREKQEKEDHEAKKKAALKKGMGSYKKTAGVKPGRGRGRGRGRGKK